MVEKLRISARRKMRNIHTMAKKGEGPESLPASDTCLDNSSPKLNSTGGARTWFVSWSWSLTLAKDWHGALNVLINIWGIGWEVWRIARFRFYLWLRLLSSMAKCFSLLPPPFLRRQILPFPCTYNICISFIHCPKETPENIRYTDVKHPASSFFFFLFGKWGVTLFHSYLHEILFLDENTTLRT